MFDDIAIDLWSSWNFSSTKDIIKTCNPTVRILKFTFNIKIYKEFIGFRLERNFVPIIHKLFFFGLKPIAIIDNLQTENWEASEFWHISKNIFFYCLLSKNLRWAKTLVSWTLTIDQEARSIPCMANNFFLYNLILYYMGMSQSIYKRSVLYWVYISNMLTSDFWLLNVERPRRLSSCFCSTEFSNDI